RSGGRLRGQGTRGSAPFRAAPRPRREGSPARALEARDAARQRPLAATRLETAAPVAAGRTAAELRLPRAVGGLVPRRGQARRAVRRRVRAGLRQAPVGNPAMLLDAPIACDLAGGASLAAGLEADGYDGVWTAETQHDAFLPLAAAAVSTERVTLGTAIATAF